MRGWIVGLALLGCGAPPTASTPSTPASLPGRESGLVPSLPVPVPIASVPQLPVAPTLPVVPGETPPPVPTVTVDVPLPPPPPTPPVIPPVVTPPVIPPVVTPPAPPVVTPFVAPVALTANFKVTCALVPGTTGCTVLASGGPSVPTSVNNVTQWTYTNATPTSFTEFSFVAVYQLAAGGQSAPSQKIRWRYNVTTDSWAMRPLVDPAPPAGAPLAGAFTITRLP